VYSSIRGTNLANVTSINVSGGAGVTAGITTGGTVTATNLPVTIQIVPGAIAGTRALTVFTAAGTSQALNFFVTAANNIPTINLLSAPVPGLSQSAAPYYGSGFQLTVNGQSFAQPGAAVLANGAPLTTTINSTSQLVATIPPTALSAAGSIDLAVQQNSSGNVLLSNTVPLRVIERGDIDGNRTITMDDANAVALNVGGLGGEPLLPLSAADFNLNGNVNIADALSLGLFLNGKSPNLPVPAITSVSPPQAATGLSLTINGTGFPSNTANVEVAFTVAGGMIQRAPVSNTQPTSIQVTVPQAAISGPIQVYRLDSPAGSQPFELTVTGIPDPLLLTSVTPVKASVGDTITLTGSGFAITASNNTVSFPSAQGPILVMASAGTSNLLTVMVPNQATCGGLTVSTAAGTSNPKPFMASSQSCSVSLTGMWGASGPGKFALLEGTGFNPFSPQSNVVRFPTNTGTAIAPVVQSGSTELHVRIPDNAIPGGVTVNVGGTTSNIIAYQPSPAPVITAITVFNDPKLPVGGALNSSVPITLIGRNFLPNGTTISIAGGAGVATTGSVNVSPYSISATLAIAAGAGIANRSISVTTSAGTSNAVTFPVYGQPTITSISPVFLGLGVNTGVTVTGTGFVAGTTLAADGGATVQPQSITVKSSTSLIANISGPSQVGTRSITATTAAGTSDGYPIDVRGLQGLFPDSGSQGTSVQVNLTGCFDVQTSVIVDGGGIDVSSVTVGAPDFSDTANTQCGSNATVTFTIHPDAAPGIRNVTVIGPDGPIPNPGSLTFAVISATPSLSSISPSSGAAGSTVSVSFVGNGFIPFPGFERVNVPNDLSVVAGSTTVTDLSHMSAQLKIDPSAVPGPRNISVTIDPFNVNVTTLPVTFTVLPTVSISPSSGPQNGFATVTLTTNIPVNGGTVVSFSGTGVIVSNLSVASSTSLTAFLTLSDPGNHTVSVTTNGTTATIPFTIVPNLIASATHLASSLVAGGPGGSGIADGTGSSARFNSPQRVWSDNTNLYIADNNNHVIRKVVIATGVTTTVAGLSGVPGSVDGVGTDARFNYPSGIWGDGTNLYVSDATNHAIRKIVLATGAVSTLAGTLGVSGLTNATGTNAKFKLPWGLCGDGTNLFVADSGNNEIRQVVISSGAVTLIAGSTTGVAGSADGVGTAAGFSFPQGVFCDGTNVFVADSANHTIRKIALGNNQVTTVAGKAATPGTADGAGGANGTARFQYPVAIWDDLTFLYVADRDNCLIRKVTISSGQTVTLSGFPSSFSFADGTGGSNGTARFYQPTGLWGVNGNLYVSDSGNNAIRIVSTSTGAATTLAGLASAYGTTDGIGPAARFNIPHGLAGDGANLYVSDQYNTRLRKIALSNAAVSTLVGSVEGYKDGTTAVALVDYPDGLWTDGVSLYVADDGNRAIRKTDNASGFTATIAPPGIPFSYPLDLWGDGTNLYVTDTDNSCIRKIVIATNTVSLLAGSGTAAWADGTGVNASFKYPGGIWGDGTYLYVADSQNHVIRKIKIATGQVTTFAGQPTVSGFSDGVGSAAHFSYPGHIWGDQSYLYVMDGNHAVRKIALNTGLVSTIAGGHAGSEDGIDSNIGIGSATGIWGDGAELFISDGANNSIRKLTPTTLSAPTLLSIAAAGGSRNTTLAVTLTGANFILGATTVAISGANVTVSSVTVTGPGTLLANFNIASGAATGARNVTVSTSVGTSAPMTFTIN
jgi:hypothetical protein